MKNPTICSHILHTVSQVPQLPPIATLLEVDLDADSAQFQTATATSSSAGGAVGLLGYGSSGGAAGSGGFMGGGALVGFGGLGQLVPRVQGSGAAVVGAGGGASAVEDARNVAQRLVQTLRSSQLPYGYDPEPLLTVRLCSCPAGMLMTPDVRNTAMHPTAWPWTSPAQPRLYHYKSTAVAEPSA